MLKNYCGFFILVETVAVCRDVLCLELANILVVYNGMGEQEGMEGKPDCYGF